MKMVDLGLTYEEAAHAMQSGVAQVMNFPGGGLATEPKHLRVGVNSALVDQQAVAQLLIDKGVFTEEEYLEYVRLAMNDEVNRYQEQVSEMMGNKVTLR